MAPRYVVCLVGSLLTLGGCGRSSDPLADGPLFTGDVAVRCDTYAGARRYTASSLSGGSTGVVVKSVESYVVSRPQVFNSFDCMTTVAVVNGNVVVAVPPAAAGVMATPDRLQFRVVSRQLSPDDAAPPIAAGQDVLVDRDGLRYIVEPALGRTPAISEASASVSPLTGMSVVSITFEPGDAADAFDAIAARALGKQLAIVLDGAIQSAPTVQTARFGGRVEISGDFTSDEASKLAGALQNDAQQLVFTEVSSAG